MSLDRQFQREGGSPPRSFAESGKVSTHFFCGQGAIVKAEAVAVFAGGESMRKDAGEVLGGDAYAVSFGDALN